jgi:hypothetical protein
MKGSQSCPKSSNRRGRAELFLRRAAARAVAGDWKGLLSLDLPALSVKNNCCVLSVELAALALAHSGFTDAAIGSFGDAAELLNSGVAYGLDEFNEDVNDEGWKAFKIATYKKLEGDLYRRNGQETKASVVTAVADNLIIDRRRELASSEKSMRFLAQFSSLPPNSRCSEESKLKAIGGSFPSRINVINRKTEPVGVYWLNEEGVRTHIMDVKANSKGFVNTFETHAFVFTDASGNCLALDVAGTGNYNVNIQ